MVAKNVKWCFGRDFRKLNENIEPNRNRISASNATLWGPEKIGLKAAKSKSFELKIELQNAEGRKNILNVAAAAQKLRNKLPCCFESWCQIQSINDVAVVAVNKFIFSLLFLAGFQSFAESQSIGENDKVFWTKPRLGQGQLSPRNLVQARNSIPLLDPDYST